MIALAWANSPWHQSYDTLWHSHVSLGFGVFRVEEDLRHFNNDGLMALFFFVVGLEIKREVVHGELADRRVAALPVFAAIGGMVGPAALYALVSGGGAGGHGWGIPMATDIAFALGVLALLGSRVPSPLKLFLLTLAIVDDVGAIVVIAVFYSGTLGGARAGRRRHRRGRVGGVAPSARRLGAHVCRAHRRHLVATPRLRRYQGGESCPPVRR